MFNNINSSSLINCIFSLAIRQLSRQSSRNMHLNQRNKNANVIRDPASGNLYLNFDASQSEKLLQIINSYSIKELTRYEISTSRANKLQTWKEKNGAFSKIEDVLKIDGIGVKVLEKLCHSLLSGTPKREKSTRTSSSPTKRVAPFILPSIPDLHQLNSIRSCLSVRVGVSSVTWSRLELCDNNPCNLTHWEHHDIIDKKIHISDLIQRCWLICQQVPNADCYILENPQTVPISTNKNADQQNISIQKSQITAALSYALFARRANDEVQKPDRVPQVLYVRRLLSARLFNHLIGRERVSSEETVTNLMRTHYNVEENKYFVDLNTKFQDASETKEDFRKIGSMAIRGEILFGEDIRSMYSKASRYHREFLGQALLLNLTFVRLVLLQDPNSIAVVSRNPKKAKSIEFE